MTVLMFQRPLQRDTLYVPLPLADLTSPGVGILRLVNSAAIAVKPMPDAAS